MKLSQNELLQRVQQLKQLSRYTGGMSPGLLQELRIAHAEKRFAAFVHKVKVFYKIDSPMRIGLVPKVPDTQREFAAYQAVASSEEKRCPGGLYIPQDMPMYGTSAFNSFQFTMIVQRWFLITPFECFLAFVSHEMAHIILYATLHPLKRCEISTDILAMITTGPDNMLSPGINMGYLDPQEIQLVSRAIKQ